MARDAAVTPDATAAAGTSGTGDAAGAAAAAAWRHEAGHLIAALLRLTHDVDLAEDLAQDAMLAALQQWPTDGIPANPGAWLMSVARRRAIDHFRRTSTRRKLVDELRNSYDDRIPAPDAETPFDRIDRIEAGDRIEDDVLRLIYLTCHPALAPDARAALTLRLACGLTTGEIARAFLVKDATIGQRISRAKRTLAGPGISFELPASDQHGSRLRDVMAAIYLIFNEGYSATTGDHWMRPELCLEALRLSRMLCVLEPEEPQVHGLDALLEIQASRTAARTDPDGQPVLLEAQDRGRWDRLLIRRGFDALDRAEALGGPVGPYVLQAAIAATHARARTPAETDWQRIADLYDLLARVTPSPVVEVNRAVAHGRAYSPDAGLAILRPLTHDPATAAWHLLPSVRGDLLARAGRTDEAVAAFLDAAALTRNERERTLLRERAHRLGASRGTG